jgi:hypothetical protein
MFCLQNNIGLIKEDVDLIQCSQRNSGAVNKAMKKTRGGDVLLGFGAV